MEPAGSGATWTGSPKGVFAERKHHKPRLSLKNNTAGVRERKDTNRTREAGNRDEVEGVVANTLDLFRGEAVGFIDWLDLSVSYPTPSAHDPVWRLLPLSFHTVYLVVFEYNWIPRCVVNVHFRFADNFYRIDAVCGFGARAAIRQDGGMNVCGR
jgi:hypothetical protein